MTIEPPKDDDGEDEYQPLATRVAQGKYKGQVARELDPESARVTSVPGAADIASRLGQMITIVDRSFVQPVTPEMVVDGYKVDTMDITMDYNLQPMYSVFDHGPMTLEVTMTLSGEDADRFYDTFMEAARE